jgi:hypothetical protein
LSLIAACYGSITVSGEGWQPGARRPTSLAVFLVLASLLLLVLSLPCPHGADTAHSAQPNTSAASLLHDDHRTDPSCTTVSGLLSATLRTAECGRPDDGSAATIHAPSVNESAAWGLPGLAAVAPETERPHGWALLVLLGIERK